MLVATNFVFNISFCYKCNESDARRFILIHLYQNPKSPHQEVLGFVNKAIGPCTEDQDYIEKIKQLQAYLDMV